MTIPPPKIERHCSEPAQILQPSSPHLLSVPQQSYLVKQHSHPLLPSQSQSPPISYTLQRQLSHPSSSTMSQLTSQLSTESIGGTITHFSIRSADDGTIKLRDVSPTVLIVTESMPTDQISSIRIKTEELQRSISSPQVILA